MTYYQELMSGFRDLTPEELGRTVRAMHFLHKKGITIDRIVTANCFQLDREAKTIAFSYNLKHLTLNRIIKYKNTPLEKQIETLPELRSKHRIFPKQVWSKRKTNLFSVPIFSEAEARHLLGIPDKKKPKALTKQGNRYILNLSI